MRTLAKILIAVGLALAVSSTASATISITLTQTGGTYDGVSVTPSDTLVLAISVEMQAGDALTGVFAELVYGGVGGFNSGTEQPFNFINAVLLTPIGTPGADIVDTPGVKVIGWEATTLATTGAPGPATFLIGTATFHLNGSGGVISVGANSIVGGANFVDITGSSNLGTFSIVPEPTTASLIGLGLLGLTVAGRNRKN